MLGALVSGVDYVQAVRRRRELRAELQAAMTDLDVVLTAAQPSEAPKSTPCRHGTPSRRRALRCRLMSPAIPRSRSARGLARADCRSRSSSSASHFRSRPCSASPTPSKKRRRSAAGARKTYGRATAGALRLASGGTLFQASMPWITSAGMMGITKIELRGEAM